MDANSRECNRRNIEERSRKGKSPRERSLLSAVFQFIRARARPFAVSTLLLAFQTQLFVPAHGADAFPEPRYKIAVCDWMILKRQKLGAFERAREIGADGVELDMGGLGNRSTFDSKLMDPIERRKFRDASVQYNIEICAIAMSGFYAQSFAERDGAVEVMARDCINTMEIMGVKTAFLPLGVQSDLVLHPELRPAVVERLKAVGKMAEAANVVVGIETAYDAAGDAKLLDDIGSPNIKIFFNFANALQNGRDLLDEIRTLGRDRICMIHCTNADGVWLEHDPQVDMRAVKACLDEMGWSGWLVIERSRDANDPRNVVGNFGANARYLKRIFKANGSGAVSRRDANERK